LLGSFGVVKDILDAMPHVLVNDTRAGIDDFNPMFGIAVNLAVCESSLPPAAGFHSLSLPVDEPSCVTFIEELTPDCQRIPLSTAKRRYTCLV
jgi:hypothetical protein